MRTTRLHWTRQTKKTKYTGLCIERKNIKLRTCKKKKPINVHNYILQIKSKKTLIQYVNNMNQEKNMNVHERARKRQCEK